MNRHRILLDPHTASNLEVLATLWGQHDIRVIIAQCVQRVAIEEIERAVNHTNPAPRVCRLPPDKKRL